MKFDYTPERLVTDALEATYFLVPWDTEIFGFPVAQISDFRILHAGAAENDFGRFTSWAKQFGVTFVSTRVEHHQVTESLFLQARGFRFIELLYRPQINLEHMEPEPIQQFDFSHADESDRGELVEMAANIFVFGRFHQDPAIGPELGSQRYRAWMDNAFILPHQRVVKCAQNNETVAFFVVENSPDGKSFWSLVGMRKDLQGQGLGKLIWREMLCWQKSCGIQKVSTSISSLNPAIFNLYARLGFRFPAPQISLHWHA